MSDNRRKVIINNRAFFDEIAPYLHAGQGVSFPVRGGSMRPFLQEGDKVLIKKPIAHVWKRGDVLLAKWQERYVLHRLVKRKQDLFGLAGDANFVRIEWVREKDIIAVALSAYRDDKKVWAAENEFTRMLGMGWYYLRPLRRLVAKLKK